MKVTLVAITKPQIEGLESVQDFIAYCARVSNPGNQLNTETAPKLLKYLMKHSHWSPFEMASMCVQIDTTRDIARQILRHRSFSFQEFSQRYAKVSREFELREARLQDSNNRQNSIEVRDEVLERDWAQQQMRVVEIASQAYDWALEHGIAKEQARSVLPEGNTPSTLYMSGTMRSWIHYCGLRSAHGTQKEHMEVAQAAGKILREQGFDF